jgi:hypothetical protein
MHIPFSSLLRIANEVAEGLAFFTFLCKSTYSTWWCEELYHPS